MTERYHGWLCVGGPLDGLVLRQHGEAGLTLPEVGTAFQIGRDDLKPVVYEYTGDAVDERLLLPVRFNAALCGPSRGERNE